MELNRNKMTILHPKILAKILTYAIDCYNDIFSF
jgi:hypothetical protein